MRRGRFWRVSFDFRSVRKLSSAARTDAPGAFYFVQLISADFTIPGTEIRVPGFLVWGALIYTGICDGLTHSIGKPLVGLNFQQQRYEADFRFSLARLREYGEQVALLGGERAERERLGGRFGNVIGNFLAIVSRTKKLTAFTASYSQVNAVIPYILIAPYYFAGKIPLGGMTQTAGAFEQVSSTMSFFITFYTTLADYKAVVDRLTSFDAAIDQAREVGAASALTVREGPTPELRIDELALGLPDGRRILEAHGLVLRPGETTLFTGPSGSGKSTLFRAISGIWPFGEGRIATPKGASMMLLPQRPYIPVGTLRGAVVLSGGRGRLPRCGYCGGAQGGAAAAIRRAAARGGVLGAVAVARRAAAARDRPRAPGQARLAVPRRGDRGARRADGGGDLPAAARAPA